jgi:hypothetical protein
MRSVSRRFITALTALLLAAPLLLAGCKQGEGDRCQLDEDCSEGLRCCYQVANPSAQDIIETGGTCTPNDKCTLKQDASIGDDLGSDLGADGTTPDDAKVDAPAADSAPKPDTGKPDTGKPDTGTPDTGTPDTGTPDTSATDTSSAG